MTFIMTVYCNEGIVMASDSRLTLSRMFQKTDDTPEIALDVVQSDATYKTFLAPNNVGISTCGDAGVNGVPLAGYIEAFIGEKIASSPSGPIEDEDGYAMEVDEVAKELLDYFRTLPGPPDTDFNVAGYKTVEESKRVQHIYRVSVSKNECKLVNSPGELGDQGATWAGESDIIFRLIQQVYAKVTDSDGKDQYVAMDSPDIAFQYFTLQDAVDFATFAVRVTGDTIRFIAARAKTVGGPIDVLVIKPREAFWVQRKELHVQ